MAKTWDNTRKSHWKIFRKLIGNSSGKSLDGFQATRCKIYAQVVGRSTKTTPGSKRQRHFTIYKKVISKSAAQSMQNHLESHCKLKEIHWKIFEKIICKPRGFTLTNQWDWLVNTASQLSQLQPHSH